MATIDMKYFTLPAVPQRLRGGVYAIAAVGALSLCAIGVSVKMNVSPQVAVSEAELWPKEMQFAQQVAQDWDRVWQTIYREQLGSAYTPPRYSLELEVESSCQANGCVGEYDEVALNVPHFEMLNRSAVVSLRHTISYGVVQLAAQYVSRDLALRGFGGGFSEACLVGVWLRNSASELGLADLPMMERAMQSHRAMISSPYSMTWPWPNRREAVSYQAPLMRGYGSGKIFDCRAFGD